MHVSGSRKQDLEDARRIVERGYQPFRETNRMLDNMRTRVTYYRVSLGIAEKLILPELQAKAPLIEVLEELLGDALLLLPYDVRSIEKI